MTAAERIIRAAIAARTLDDAALLQDAIAQGVGARHQRPLGDRWSNIGHITRGGSADHKLIELVTNAQDAVIELRALQRFGAAHQVPYKTPREAGVALLGEMPWREAAGLVEISFHEAGGPPRKLGRLTPIFRDAGCGMTASYLPQSLFYLGTRHKGKAAWQQGAFGIGGASTFRHAEAVVLATRRHPDLLSEGEEDRIAVAVCQWEEFDKGSGLFYLTTTAWDEGRNLTAEPWSAPASEVPDFEAGTQIALIGYEPQRIHKAAWGGEWAFERMLNTRLFDPVTPVRVNNRVSEKAHPQHYRGLRKQLVQNPRDDRKELGPEAMPFRLDGSTYHLPVTAYYFEAGPSADVGGKRNFVNPEHALMFVSNGQTHHHWTPRELRDRTALKHIYDRALVVVDLDELPIKVRTRLVSPERQGFVDRDDTRRLQRQLGEFLDGWDELVEFDRELLRKAISGDSNGRPTISIAQQIGRALKFKGGFRLSGGNGNGDRGRKRRKKLAKAELYPDPTTIEGPGSLRIEQGATRMPRFHVNAEDAFMYSGRGALTAASNHPDIGTREITVGALHNGFVRVAIAVPEDAALGEFKLTAKVTDWQKSAGGIGADLVWETAVKIIEPILEEERRQLRRQQSEAERPSGDGELVGLAWKTEDAFDAWHAGVPGHVDEVEATMLAEEHEDYAGLATLGQTKIPTIFLNRDYTPLKRYEGARAAELTVRGLDEARDRYAVGAGLGLLLLDRDLKAKANGHGLPPEAELAAKQAAARATLVMMPQFDRLAREAGIEE